jgi:hypothetical protein
MPPPYKLFDQTNCPNDAWLVEMANTLLENTHIFINVGFNKGYNFATWMNAFIPQTNITPKSWHSALVNTRSQNMTAICGVCTDCKLEFSRSLLKFSNVKHKHSNDVVMIGLDLNCKNIEIVDGIIGQVNSSANTSMSGVTVYMTCAAVSDHIGEIQLPKCVPAGEGCSLRNSVAEKNVKANKSTTTTTTTTSDTAASIPILTLDNFVHNFTQSHQHNHKHVRRLAQLLADNPIKQIPRASQIDILLIDAEGNDALVIRGAKLLLQKKAIRCLMFEYHEKTPWRDMLLQTTIQELDSFGYDCFFEGQSRLWRISRECWHSLYEFHHWSNVMCILRTDIWMKSIHRYIVTRDTIAEILQNSKGRQFNNSTKTF